MNVNLHLDMLALGPHPDDVELFCGGTLARMVQRGHRVGVVDLTEAERASNGTPEVRRREAEAAAEVLGLSVRENLRLPDAGLDVARPEQVDAVAAAIRRHRPEVLLIPWTTARHPDHAATGEIARRAVFLAGLRKVDVDGEPYRPRQVLVYQMRHRFRPSFLVDISPAAEIKQRAIACYESQIAGGEKEAHTLIGSPRAVSAIVDRDRYYGSMLGVSHAEPFLVEATVGLVDPIRHFRDNPFPEAHAFESPE